DAATESFDEDGVDDALTASAVRAAPVTVAIPTYRREQVLVDTIAALLRFEPPPAEILILDQTRTHTPVTDDALRRWDENGRIRWLRLPAPSIPAAMNRGLLEARQDVVLFLDDDIVPDAALIGAHANARHPRSLVAGRVLQPWDRDAGDAAWAEH